jgi:hypothetical protein
MFETERVCEPKTSEEAMEEMGKALHDLCQPLTTLQCRLELAGLVGTDAAYREAVELGLAECIRMVKKVCAMREIVLAARLLQPGEPGGTGR